jgi:hypothetical protein
LEVGARYFNSLGNFNVGVRLPVLNEPFDLAFVSHVGTPANAAIIFPYCVRCGM